MRKKLVAHLHLVVAHEIRLHLHALPLHCVTQSTRQSASLNLPFDQIVLRALFHSLIGQFIVFQTRHYNHHYIRVGSARAAQRLQPMAVWQPHIEQDNVDFPLAKLYFRLPHVRQVR